MECSDPLVLAVVIMVSGAVAAMFGTILSTEIKLKTPRILTFLITVLGIMICVSAVQHSITCALPSKTVLSSLLKISIPAIIFTGIVYAGYAELLSKKLKIEKG